MAKRRPECSQHLGSKVWFDGRYGTPTHRRQRYKCLPADGSPRHVFTEVLPRMHGGTGECLECERDYAAHEGPPTGRKFQYTTRDIAYALMEVGKGRPDRIVGRDVRTRAGRTYARDGNTVADWVELYAPAVFEPHKPTEWPRIVALDAKPFHVRKKDDYGDPVQGGKIAFNVLGAYGWDKRGKGELLSLRAAPNFGLKQGFPHWLAFLDHLCDQLGDGQPEQFVCDQDDDILNAIETMWPPTKGPSPVVFRCHWHLGEKVREMIRKAGVDQSDDLRVRARHERDNPLCPCVFCGDGPRWDTWEQDARARKIRQLTNWLNRNGTLIRWQLDNRNQLRAKTSTGPLEQVFSQITNAFDNRRGLIHNRERLDRRLMLMQLDLTGKAKQGEYAKVIREELLTNQGFGGPRYVVDDKNGSSLRLYAPKGTP